MRYRYCPNSADWYATNLRQDRGTGNLTWDNNRGQDVLIVQTPFEYNAENLMEELCQLMEEAVLQTDSYTEVKTGVWVRFVTAADKARDLQAPTALAPATSRHTARRRRR